MDCRHYELGRCLKQPEMKDSYSIVPVFHSTSTTVHRECAYSDVVWIHMHGIYQAVPNRRGLHNDEQDCALFEPQS